MTAAERGPGPAWLGIGAQRSGTGWLSRLLVQHPGMDFGTNGRKEQQALSQPGGPSDVEAYRALFPPDSARGEWTPFYLRALSTPYVVARVCRQQAPLIVLLRDPVERFASAMRLWAMRKQRQDSQPFGLVFGDAHWAGMYADQLDAWAPVVGRDRLLVFTYETAREDPQPVCDAIWQRLALPSVRVSGVERPSPGAAGHVGWEWPDGLRDALTALYAPQVERLGRDWGVEVGRWASFAR